MADLKIMCLGGASASFCFFILMKKQNPDHDIIVIEHGSRDATWQRGDLTLFFLMVP